ncbi:DUF3999 domain-containing protein [Diaphorobacter sp. HDW4A]|uniref:DUF3999 domain-containing protein n=1 Tax=Diaphorobacter sp. HDW4A TaxID=2714924 RepID=UPI00140A9205|nr:DUF3999 domain-containing protein [Diaphorobacter sp. HDW4A]QIL83387.1 DUF3999 domain-containing protein [Diaphorobacter sp. HDW4A]
MMRALFVRLACSLVVGAGLSTSAVSKEQLADFGQRLPLTLQGEGPWYGVAIPMEVRMSASHADLSDLRVFDAGGESVPFALVTDAAAPATNTLRDGGPVRLFPLRTPVAAGAAQPDIRIQQNGTIVELRTTRPATAASADQKDKVYGWLIDASKIDFPLERLQLDWSSRGEGFQSFSIEASDDLQRWSHWGSGQIARLSFEGERLDVSEIKLSGQKARYLRLLWPRDATAVEVKSARLLGSTRTRSPAPLAWSEPIAGRLEKDGEFRWQLPQSLPLQRVRVALSKEVEYTVAPVDLSGRDVQKSSSTMASQRRERQDNYWRPLARGVLYRLPVDGRTVQVDELEIASFEPVNELRLRVDSRGAGLGGQVPQLSVAMPSSRLVFLARDKAPYELAFVNAKARAADLPLNVLIPGYNDDKPPVWDRASLAPFNLAQATADAQSAAIKDASARDWKKYSLWAMLLLGVGMLVLMASSLIRKK